MPARLLTISIIGFWIVMTGLLIQSVWYPADSQLTKVNPGAVLQLIAARGENSTLDIYDGRRIVGRLNIHATRHWPEQIHDVRLRINGRIRLEHPLLDGVNLDLESWAELDHGGEVMAFDLRLNAGRNDLKLTISQAGPEDAPSVQLKRGGVVLLNSDGLTAKNLESQPLLAVLFGSFGVSLKDLSAIGQQAEKQAAGTAMEARQGTFDLNGTERQGFILKFGTPGQPGFRLCVENTGEIVRLETPTSYQLLTESLRPLPTALP